MSSQEKPARKVDAEHLSADALRVFAAFNRIHDNVLWLVVEYQKAAPHRGWPSKLQTLGEKLTDENTAAVVREIARLVGSSAQLGEFQNYFKHVKDLRDLMAHSMVLEVVKEDEKWVLDIGHYHEDKRASRVLKGGLLSHADLETIGAKMLWLLMQIDWIRIEASLAHGPGAVRWIPTRPLARPKF